MKIEEAKEFVNRIDTIDKKIYNDANINREIIKRVRQFLQKIEDNTWECEDCNFNKFDLFDISIEDLVSITKVFNEAEKIKEEKFSLDSDLGAIKYCRFCIRDLAKNGEFAPEKCYTSWCMNKRSSLTF